MFTRPKRRFESEIVYAKDFFATNQDVVNDIYMVVAKIQDVNEFCPFRVSYFFSIIILKDQPH